ncbi:MAG: peptidylprolyl isomerase [Candidatus Sumerlaeia bacterium]|nr:peptidylprolyl isomerase [Candidatus Sumerlaeia bacterium]
MKLVRPVLTLLVLLHAAVCFAQEAPRPGDPGPALDFSQDYYAAIHTSMGRVVVKLDAELMPITVQSFVNLATGTKPWLDPRTREVRTSPFYDGLIFHRAIPNFMIQGGDPTGTGSGRIGFNIRDEANSLRTFRTDDLVIAMARTGAPNSASSQFFLTEERSHPAHLDTMNFAIFGKVVAGKEVIHAIARVPTTANAGGERSQPINPVHIRHVQIIRVPKGDAGWQAQVIEIDPAAPYVAPAAAPVAPEATPAPVEPTPEPAPEAVP